MTLEQLCPFAIRCPEEKDIDNCYNNYFDCKAFQMYLKEEIEKYEIHRFNKK